MNSSVHADAIAVTPVTWLRCLTLPFGLVCSLILAAYNVILSLNLATSSHNLTLPFDFIIWSYHLTLPLNLPTTWPCHLGSNFHVILNDFSVSFKCLFSYYIFPFLYILHFLSAKLNQAKVFKWH